MHVTCLVCKGHPNRVSSVLKVRISCPTCHGEGGFDIPDDKELCPVCKGETKVFIPGTQYREKCDCDKCKALGYVHKA